MSVFVEHLIIYLQYRSIGNAYPFFLLANHAWPIKKMKLVKRSWAVIAVLCSNIWRKVLQGNQLFAWHWLSDNITGMASIVAGEIKDVYSELCTRTRKHYHGLFYIIEVYKFLFTIVWYYIDDEVCIS